MKAGRLTRIIGLLVVAASVAYLVALARQAADLPRLRWDGPSLAGFAASVGLYQVALAGGAVAWTVLLAATGERPRLRSVLAVQLLSQPAKYLPGNVAQYAGRTVLAARQGHAPANVLATLVVETACAVIAGAAFALALLGPAGRSPWGGEALLWRGGAVLLAVAAAGLLAGRLLGRPGFRHLVRLPPAPEGGLIGLGAWLACIACNWLTFLLLGLCAALLARAFFGAAAPFAEVAGVFAAAWVAGFVTPGAPAGLGVREAVLAAGLRPLYGPDVALALPLLFRMVTVTGDGVAFALGTLLRRCLPLRSTDGAA
jgi:glycosyltransferase 2 family protein